MDARALDTLKHLREIEVTDLIKETGLYMPILIDTFSDKINYALQNNSIGISDDVKRLYSLLVMNGPLYLPCSTCKKELAFNKIHNTAIDKKPWALGVKDANCQMNENGSADSGSYHLYSQVLQLGNGDKSKNYAASVTCKNVLLENLSFFLIELVCSLNQQHTIRCFFSLSSFEVDEYTQKRYHEYQIKKLKVRFEESALLETSDEEKEAIRLYEMAEHTIVIKKVGQFPSLVDMQFFNLQKYKKLLKSNYQELTKAVGLHAAGVGIGSFVYLRRIFESLCEDAHQACIVRSDWDELEYSKKRFNEKMDYLAQFGRKVIPDELNAIKLKLYGVMSKGIHEYSEDDCQALFPYVKTAIELILDQKLAELEKQKKIDELAKAIGTAKT